MIKRYRIRKVYEAVRLESDNQREIEQFLWDRHGAIGGGCIPNLIEPTKWAVTWNNKGEPGTRTAYEGDYIVKYDDGCAPLPADLFEKRYEAVGRGVLALEAGGQANGC
jgi:hypothetical protein